MMGWPVSEVLRALPRHFMAALEGWQRVHAPAQKQLTMTRDKQAELAGQMRAFEQRQRAKERAKVGTDDAH